MFVKPREYISLLLSVLFLVGCMAVGKKALTTPPLPFSESESERQRMLAVARSTVVIVGPPKPIIFSMTIPQTFSDMQGMNLWHPFIYVQMTTNMIDWVTITNIPLSATPITLTLTNNNKNVFYRTSL